MTQTLRRELRIKFDEILKEESLFGSLWTNTERDAVNELLNLLVDRLADAALAVAGIAKKEIPAGSDVGWMIAANIPNEEIASVLEKERHAKEITDTFEVAMGYSPLNWSGELGKLKRFLLTKTVEEIRAFAKWSKRDYSTLRPEKIRMNPQLAIDCWNLAFDVNKCGSEIKEHLL